MALLSMSTYMQSRQLRAATPILTEQQLARLELYLFLVWMSKSSRSCRIKATRLITIPRLLLSLLGELILKLLVNPADGDLAVQTMSTSSPTNLLVF